MVALSIGVIICFILGAVFEAQHTKVSSVLSAFFFGGAVFLIGIILLMSMGDLGASLINLK